MAASQGRAHQTTAGDDYDSDVPGEKRWRFGVPVPESDPDMGLLTAYRACKELWIIGEAFRM